MAYVSLEAEAGPQPPFQRTRRFLRRFARSRMGMLGAGILAIFIVTAIFAPVLMPFDPYAVDLKQVARAPSWIHPFGTDKLGRDLLSRVMYGARTSLLLGLCVVVSATLIGLTLGAAAGYFRGMVDRVLVFLIDVLMTLPSIMIALAIASVLGPGLVSTTIAIAIAGVPRLARVSRGAVLAIRGLDYVECARGLGLTDAVILRRHVVPNAVAPIVVEASLLMAEAVLVAAGLGFLGLGVAPPTAEWGQMVAEGRGYIRTAPSIPLFPGFAIILLALGFNLVGDGLRDTLDVRN
jgi:peptide/nickel transport system permease protein